MTFEQLEKNPKHGRGLATQTNTIRAANEQ